VEVLSIQLTAGADRGRGEKGGEGKTRKVIKSGSQMLWDGAKLFMEGT